MQSGFVIQWCSMLSMIFINFTVGTEEPKCDKTCTYSLMKGPSRDASEGILHIQDPKNNTNWLPVCYAKLDYNNKICLKTKIASSSSGSYPFPNEVLHFPNTIIANRLVRLTANMCINRSQIEPVLYELCTETKQSGCCNPLAICYQSAPQHTSDIRPAECSRNWTGAQSKSNDKHCPEGHETLSMSRICRENITRFAGRAWIASAFQKICGGDNATMIKNVESGLNRCLQDWNTRPDPRNNYVIIDQYLNCSWSPNKTCTSDQVVTFKLLESEENNFSKDLYCIAANMTEGWNFTVEKCTTLLPPFCGKSQLSTTKQFDDTSPPKPSTVSTVTYMTPSTDMTLTKDMTSRAQTDKEVVVIAITVPTCVMVVALSVIGVCFWYTRKNFRSRGDSPRVNSIVNQTYGENLSETYHLLDESRLDESPNPPLPMRDDVHELSVLGVYSMPLDSIVPDLKRVDNDLTYDGNLTCNRKGPSMITGKRNDPRALINGRQRTTRKALSEDKGTIGISIVGYNCLHDSLPKHYKVRSTVITNELIQKLRSESDIIYHIKNKHNHVDNSALESSVDVETDFKRVFPTHFDSKLETNLNDKQDDSSVALDVCRPKENFCATPPLEYSYSDCISTHKAGAVGDDYVDTESFVEPDDLGINTLFKDHVCLDCLTQEQLDMLGIRIVNVDDTYVTYENLPNRFSDTMSCDVGGAETYSEEATFVMDQSGTKAKAKDTVIASFHYRDLNASNVENEASKTSSQKCTFNRNNSYDILKYIKQEDTGSKNQYHTCNDVRIWRRKRRIAHHERKKST
ncbi:uncharacterized protein LOC127867856 [Dreissena polymorpha]|uniref:Uncharacterized protein n=1 Tax=Dreissena polymorpha TaxID=45954 RepID=A0A9D4M5G1_DREPO|nr:uncharacterized protein LOC127867856 [Dreissena polymorpha]KAH3868721.1 hypothetical protein DPMN_031873 [Dreissena polymorpha]